MASEIVIVGNGAHARVTYDILQAEGKTEQVSAFVDVEGKSAEGETIFGKPVMVGLAAFDDYIRANDVTAILGHGNNSRRKAIMGWLEERNVQTASAMHPSAIISPGAEIGDCSTISPGVIILTGAKIGRGVILNTAATVDHDCVIEDFAQLAPGANLAGRVTVGTEAFVGIGAVVIQNVTVGAKCVIGASAAVVRDTPPDTLVIGVPARVRRRL